MVFLHSDTLHSNNVTFWHFHILTLWPILTLAESSFFPLGQPKKKGNIWAAFENLMRVPFWPLPPTQNLSFFLPFYILFFFPFFSLCSSAFFNYFWPGNWKMDREGEKKGDWGREKIWRLQAKGEPTVLNKKEAKTLFLCWMSTM